jgi:hypothetical protein
VASQLFSWLTAQLLKLRFAVEPHAPPGVFARGHERCLILAPTHQTVLDPWLIVSGRPPQAGQAQALRLH